MAPVELGDDGESITIRDESFGLDPKSLEWLKKQPNIGNAVKSALRAGAQRLTIDGTRVASTAQVLEIVRLAQEAGLERQLSPEIVRRLDPDGWHVFSARPQLLEGGVREEQGGVAMVRGEFKLGEPLPCSALLKLRGQQKSVESMMDVPFMEFMVLDFAQTKNPKSRLVFEGESQRAVGASRI